MNRAPISKGPKVLHQVRLLLVRETEPLPCVIELHDGLEGRRDPVVEVGRMQLERPQRRRAVQLRRAPRGWARRAVRLGLAHYLRGRMQPDVRVCEQGARVTRRTLTGPGKYRPSADHRGGIEAAGRRLRGV